MEEETISITKSSLHHVRRLFIGKRQRIHELEKSNAALKKACQLNPNPDLNQIQSRGVQNNTLQVYHQQGSSVPAIQEDAGLGLSNSRQVQPNTAASNSVRGHQAYAFTAGATPSLINQLQEGSLVGSASATQVGINNSKGSTNVGVAGPTQVLEQFQRVNTQFRSAGATVGVVNQQKNTISYFPNNVPSGHGPEVESCAYNKTQVSSFSSEPNTSNPSDISQSVTSRQGQQSGQLELQIHNNAIPPPLYPAGSQILWNPSSYQNVQIRNNSAPSQGLKRVPPPPYQNLQNPNISCLPNTSKPRDFSQHVKSPQGQLSGQLQLQHHNSALFPPFYPAGSQILQRPSLYQNVQNRNNSAPPQGLIWRSPPLHQNSQNPNIPVPLQSNQTPTNQGPSSSQVHHQTNPAQTSSQYQPQQKYASLLRRHDLPQPNHSASQPNLTHANHHYVQRQSLSIQRGCTNNTSVNELRSLTQNQSLAYPTHQFQYSYPVTQNASPTLFSLLQMPNSNVQQQSSIVPESHSYHQPSSNDISLDQSSLGKNPNILQGVSTDKRPLNHGAQVIPSKTSVVRDLNTNEDECTILFQSTIKSQVEDSFTGNLKCNDDFSNMGIKNSNQTDSDGQFTPISQSHCPSGPSISTNNCNLLPSVITPPLTPPIPYSCKSVGLNSSTHSNVTSSVDHNLVNVQRLDSSSHFNINSHVDDSSVNIQMQHTPESIPSSQRDQSSSKELLQAEEHKISKDIYQKSFTSMKKCKLKKSNGSVTGKNILGLSYSNLSFSDLIESDNIENENPIQEVSDAYSLEARSDISRRSSLSTPDNIMENDNISAFSSEHKKQPERGELSEIVRRMESKEIPRTPSVSDGEVIAATSVSYSTSTGRTLAPVNDSVSNTAKQKCLLEKPLRKKLHVDTNTIAQTIPKTDGVISVRRDIFPETLETVSDRSKACIPITQKTSSDRSKTPISESRGVECSLERKCKEKESSKLFSINTIDTEESVCSEHSEESQDSVHKNQPEGGKLSDSIHRMESKEIPRTPSVSDGEVIAATSASYSTSTSRTLAPVNDSVSDTAKQKCLLEKPLGNKLHVDTNTKAQTIPKTHEVISVRCDKCPQTLETVSDKTKACIPSERSKTPIPESSGVECTLERKCKEKGSSELFSNNTLDTEESNKDLNFNSSRVDEKCTSSKKASIRGEALKGPLDSESYTISYSLEEEYGNNKISYTVPISKPTAQEIPETLENISSPSKEVTTDMSAVNDESNFVEDEISGEEPLESECSEYLIKSSCSINNLDVVTEYVLLCDRGDCLANKSLRSEDLLVDKNTSPVNTGPDSNSQVKDFQHEDSLSSGSQDIEDRFNDSEILKDNCSLEKTCKKIQAQNNYQSESAAPAKNSPSKKLPTSKNVSTPHKAEKEHENNHLIIRLKSDKGSGLVGESCPEECPMCYTELCPSRFYVNVKTFNMNTKCTGCGLLISIIHEDEPVTPKKPRKRPVSASDITPGSSKKRTYYY